MKNIIFIYTLLFAVSQPSVAASIYIAELDPLQSSFFKNFDDTITFQLSGTIKVIVDNDFIQFEDIDITSSPAHDTSGMILSDIGNYNGANFQYVLCDTCLGNAYEGTFDGSSLLLQGITFGSSDFNYTIISSSVTTVPLPNSFILLSTALAGLGFRYRKNKSNTSFKRDLRSAAST